MGRFPGEDSCLTLVWAVLDLLITRRPSEADDPHAPAGVRILSRGR